MGAKKKRLFDELDQTHLQRFLSAVILKKSLCVTELILHHKKPFFPPPQVSKQWHIQVWVLSLRTAISALAKL